MASISKSPNGTKSLQFFDGNGDRKTIYLGVYTQKNAETVKAKVEELLSSKQSQCSWSRELSDWVKGLDGVLGPKLAAHGLLPGWQKSELGTFLGAFLKKREQAKPNSLKNYKAAVKKLLEHFDPCLELGKLSKEAAEKWATGLTTKGYAKAYCGRLVKFARQFFHEAARQKLITENPFAGIKAQAQSNRSRKFFVTRDVTAKVLESCPDHEWRLVVALARFGGLRCPSEVLALEWEGIDWDRNRFLILSPKTEHHEGQAERWVPIFPELRAHLDAAWEAAEEGAVHVISRRRRECATNLRTGLERAIKRAGLKPWPKLFVNLRASRETELVAEFPIHVVCSWLGNSARVAAEHYLQVTDADFDRAAGQSAALSAALNRDLDQKGPSARAIPLSAAIGGKLAASSGNTAKNAGFDGKERHGAEEVEENHYTRQESNL